MTAAEQVARALRESECMLLDCESCKNLEPCPTNIALAEFVEAADKVRRDECALHIATTHPAYDAALKRLAEVLR